MSSLPAGQVSASQDVTEPYELTRSAILVGVLLGIVFGASSLYLALRVGMTVSASIPVAVLSITLSLVAVFLPGDSLLFVVGTLCGSGLLNLPLVMGLLVVAAISGDQVNYRIGSYFGPKVFQWENSRFFNRAAFDKAHNFYETYGGITIVLARFMPFIRTFVPFVAGVAAMTPSRFLAFNVMGGLIWVCGLTSAGYLFGETAFVQAHLSQIIWAMIFVPGLFALWGAWRARQS